MITHIICSTQFRFVASQFDTSDHKENVQFTPSWPERTKLGGGSARANRVVGWATDIRHPWSSAMAWPQTSDARGQVVQSACARREIVGDISSLEIAAKDSAQHLGKQGCQLKLPNAALVLSGLCRVPCKVAPHQEQMQWPSTARESKQIGSLAGDEVHKRQGGHKTRSPRSHSISLE